MNALLLRNGRSKNSSLQSFNEYRCVMMRRCSRRRCHAPRACVIALCTDTQHPRMACMHASPAPAHAHACVRAPSRRRQTESLGPQCVTSEGLLLEYETLELRLHPPNVQIDNETYDDVRRRGRGGACVVHPRVGAQACTSSVRTASCPQRRSATWPLVPAGHGHHH